MAPEYDLGAKKNILKNVVCNMARICLVLMHWLPRVTGDNSLCNRAYSKKTALICLDYAPAQCSVITRPGSAFIKPDQLDPSIKVQIEIILLPTISHLPLPNFVSCGRACPSHMRQILVTVGAKLWTAERFLLDPWSMDFADPVW